MIGAGEPSPGELPEGLAYLTVGVVPAGEARARPRLLAALEAAYPVRFVARDIDAWDGLDAVVAFGDVAIEGVAVPVLAAARPERAAGAERAVRLAHDARLAAPLRGLRLHDRHVGGGISTPGDQVLATAEGLALWTVQDGDGRPPRHLVAHAPAELAPGEALRERLLPGRSLALLALAHFLADLTARQRWTPPGPRAAFVLDDPNLHWPTYGHVDYEALRAHADRHRHHVAIATVPLDAWLVHPRAARSFRDGASGLSLCVHGNDHTGPELWNLDTDADAIAAAAQALRRVTALERRSGVPVSRVMVPPHEKVSESSARALLALGYEAVCNTRPYPWAREVPTGGAQWLARPSDAGPLTGWHSVDVVGGGLPVLLRAGFEHPREDLALRAFLGQPLILYGHQDDLRDGLGVLEQAAADVNALGDVRWGPLHTMSRANVETLRAGSTLHVRPLARRVRVDVPDGIDELAVDRRAFRGELVERVSLDGAVAPAPSRVPVAGPGAVELTLTPAQPAEPHRIAAPRRRVWPVVRRVAVELRDRADPVLARA